MPAVVRDRGRRRSLRFNALDTRDAGEQIEDAVLIERLPSR